MGLPTFKRLAFRLLVLLAAIGLVLLLVSPDLSENDDPQKTLNRGLSTDPDSLDPHKYSSVEAARILRDF